MTDKELLDHIRASLGQRKSKEEIYKDLLNQGHAVDAIQDAFNQIEAGEEKEDTQTRTVGIIITIGAILVAAGIFSFVASNWQEMSRQTKLLVIVMSMLTANTAGWFLKEQWDYEKSGEALFVLGSCIFGAGIFLVAQMFHIRASWPDGFILWMVGVVAMAFAVESFLLFSLAIPLGFLAISGYPLEIFTRMAGHDRFLLTSSFLLLGATIVTFVSAWTIRQKMPPDIKELY